MNFLQLVNELRRECSVAGNGLTTVVAQTGESQRLVQWIKQANDEIQGKYFDWLFLRVADTFDTLAGNDTVSKPDDLNIWDVQRFYIGTQKLEVMDYADYEPMDADSGQPHTVIVMPDNSLLLYPNPDAAYTVSYDYYRTPNVLSIDTDEPLIPSQFHRVIVYRAMAMYANYESAQELSKQALEVYAEAMRQLQNHQLPEKSQYYGRSNPLDIQVVAQ